MCREEGFVHAGGQRHSGAARVPAWQPGTPRLRPKQVTSVTGCVQVKRVSSLGMNPWDEKSSSVAESRPTCLRRVHPPAYLPSAQRVAAGEHTRHEAAASLAHRLRDLLGARSMREEVMEVAMAVTESPTETLCRTRQVVNCCASLLHKRLRLRSNGSRPRKRCSVGDALRVAACFDRSSHWARLPTRARRGSRPSPPCGSPESGRVEDVRADPSCRHLLPGRGRLTHGRSRR
jgi:hypothetical protein